MFNRRSAERDARRYRSRGVRGSAQALAELAGDVRDAEVLDIGGGVGAIGLELLARGATHATTIELSSGYDDAAAALAAEHGVAGRVERRVGDVVDDAGALGAADVVVLHRVVCCYPDAEALMSAAARLTRRRLVLTYPQERRPVAAGLALANAYLRLRRCGFRASVHRVERRVRHGLVWESAALVREGA